MNRSIPAALLGLLAGVLLACASRVESSWRDPGTTADSLRFRKVLVVAMASDGAIRRAAEDGLVEALGAGPRGQAGQMSASPSYPVLDDSDLGDVASARSEVESGGYDGLILVRFVSSEARIRVDPPMHTPMWGYYGYRGMIYDPGSVRSDTIVRLQTNIYSVSDGKLLWSGVSRTMNPRKVQDLVDDVVRDVGGSLREEGLLE